MPDFFRGGDARLEDVRAFASGDLVVLATIERQHGEVGGLPHPDCSLRVTLVFRRKGSAWRLLYRHADPLVRPIGLHLRLPHGWRHPALALARRSYPAWQGRP